MDGTYRPPATDGSGTDRKALRVAFQLLTDAGYKRNGNAMVRGDNGEPLAFEILVKNVEDENLGLALQRTCALLGVRVNVRRVESLQYEVRIKDFDYDMIRFIYPSSLSPGSEQKNRWSSAAAHKPAAFNFSGARDRAIDAMIGALLAASGRQDFVSAVRALDRVLISGFYMIPLFHAPEDWWARWTRIRHPDTTSLYGAEPTTWWAEQ